MPDELAAALPPWTLTVLQALALPEYGLASVFVVSLISATLLPMASVPFVYGLIQLNPALFWPALLVATAGNTAGGAITYAMGYGAERAYEKFTHHPPRPLSEQRAMAWLKRWGPPACLLSWLPIVGDPLCGVAGWLRLPFWRCLGWMALGKFLRYLVYTGGLVWAFPLSVAPG
jgi:membrane protein YqaA with SNARE-associated domain